VLEQEHRLLLNTINTIINQCISIAQDCTMQQMCFIDTYA